MAESKAPGAHPKLDDKKTPLVSSAEQSDEANKAEFVRRTVQEWFLTKGHLSLKRSF